MRGESQESKANKEQNHDILEKTQGKGSSVPSSRCKSKHTALMWSKLGADMLCHLEAPISCGGRESLKHVHRIFNDSVTPKVVGIRDFDVGTQTPPGQAEGDDAR